MRQRESEASASSDMSVKFVKVALWALLAAVLLSGCVFTDTVGASDLQGEWQEIVVDESMMDRDHLLQRHHSAPIRSKRNILFPSGVKLCTQETLDQATAAHLSYFHLRVCQESVWEAFKIFWDRLPERDEYHQWVSGCMNGSVSIMEIGSFFSQSHEHIALIKDRVAMAASMNSSEMTSVLNGDSQTDTTPVEDILIVGSGSPSVPKEPTESEKVLMQVPPQILKPSGGQEGPVPEEPVEVVIDPDGVDVPDSDAVEEMTPAGRELPLQVVTEDFLTEASVVVQTKSPAAETVTSQPPPSEETIVVTRREEDVVGVLEEPVEEPLRTDLQEPEGDVQDSALEKPSVHKDVSKVITGPVPTMGLMMEPDLDSEEAEVFNSVTPEPQPSHPFALTTTHMVDVREDAHTEVDEATHEESIPLSEDTEAAPKQTQPEEPVGTVATVKPPVDVVKDGESVESTSETMIVKEEPVKLEPSEAPAEPAEEEPEATGGTVEGIEPVQEVGTGVEMKPTKDTEPTEEPAEEPEVVEVEETSPGQEGVTIISVDQTPAASESLEDKVSPEEEPGETQTYVTEEMSTQIPHESKVEIHPPGVVPEGAPELHGTEELPGGSEVDIMSDLTEDNTIQVLDPSGELSESGYLPAAKGDLPSEDPNEAVTPTESQTSSEEDRVDKVTPEFHEEVPAPAEDIPLSGDTSPVVPSEVPPQDIGSLSVDVSAEHTDTPAVKSSEGTMTEEATPTPTLEVTTNYIVEYNNGNFPDLTERTYVVDQDLLGNEGFKQENSIGNEINDTPLRNLRPLRDQVVQLSIKLRGETYNDALRDPGSFYYQQLARQFTRKIEDAFERLPGFKDIQVVAFRPQKDLERGLVVLVHYAITLEVESGGIPNDTLDFISLQNNLVEKNYPGAAEQPTVVYTITDFRNYITEALHKDNFMTNSSLDTQGDPLLLGNAENLLPLVKPTSRPTDNFNNMDNILAAEKPPDAPSHELDSGSIYLKMNDFLFDPLDLWKGPQGGATVSENDVFMLEDSAAPRPPDQFPERTLDLGTSTTENLGNIEDEGFFLNKAPDAGDCSSTGDHAVSPGGSSATTAPPLDPQKTSDSMLDEASGSGFSGEGQGSDVWLSVMSDFSSSLEVVPPPDLEENEEEDGDEDVEEVLVEPTTVEDDSPPVETTDLPPPAEESLQDPDVQELFLDQILVTPHVSTNPRHSSTTQAPVFSPRGTLADELSLQTFEASGDFDEFFLTEPHVTIRPVMDSTEPDYWSREELVFIGPTNLAVGHPEISQELEVITATQLPFLTDDWTSAEDAPKTDEVQVILPAELPEVHEDPKLPEDPEDPKLPEDPEYPEVSKDPELLEIPEDSQVPEDLVTEASETEAPPTEGSLSVAEVQTVTITGSATDVMTEPAELLLAEPEDKQEVQILEEQPIGTTDLTSAAPAVEALDSDLVVDEVMVVMTTTITTVTASSVNLDQSIALHPERDSPFTRVSDSVPEDEDLHHEHLSHEDIEEVPVRSHVPQSPPTEVQPQEEKPLSDSTKQEVETSSPHNGSALSTEVEMFEQDFSDQPSIDLSFDIFQYEGNVTDTESSGFSSGAHGSDFDAMLLPTRPGQDLTVFFSLRVTNMAFSTDLFNKSSSEYKALEQRFLLLLVPHLQTNLNNFQNLEILNFRNGSIVVNSRMRFDRPVPSGLTNVVYLILEDFANTASHTMDLNIDKYSLDVESGDQADLCKFQACNEFSRCMVNQWSGEAECVCDTGYLSVDGLPCQSVCDIQHNFCLNDGKCDIIPGKGAICRCRVGENWWYRGEHCEEYVSEPLVVGIAIASVAGFLMVAGGILFFLARMLREQYDGEDTEDPVRRGDSMPTLERATKFNPMFENDLVAVQHYRRYDNEQSAPLHLCDPALLDDSSSVSVDGFKDLSTEEFQYMYQNSRLSAEEIHEHLKIIQLCTRDQQFADLVRQTQVYLERRGSSTT